MTQEFPHPENPESSAPLKPPKQVLSEEAVAVALFEHIKSDKKRWTFSSPEEKQAFLDEMGNIVYIAYIACQGRASSTTNEEHIAHLRAHNEGRDPIRDMARPSGTTKIEAELIHAEIRLRNFFSDALTRMGRPTQLERDYAALYDKQRHRRYR